MIKSNYLGSNILDPCFSSSLSWDGRKDHGGCENDVTYLKIQYILNTIFCYTEAHSIQPSSTSWFSLLLRGLVHLGRSLVCHRADTNRKTTIHSYRQFRVTSLPNLHVFALWEVLMATFLTAVVRSEVRSICQVVVVLTWKSLLTQITLLANSFPGSAIWE